MMMMKMMIIIMIMKSKLNEPIILVTSLLDRCAVEKGSKDKQHVQFTSNHFPHNELFTLHLKTSRLGLSKLKPLEISTVLETVESFAPQFTVTNDKMTCSPITMVLVPGCT